MYRTSKRGRKIVASVLLLLGLAAFVGVGPVSTRNIVGLIAIGIFWLAAAIALYSLYMDWYCRRCGEKIARGKKPAGSCPSCGAEEYTTSRPTE